MAALIGLWAKGVHVFRWEKLKCLNVSGMDLREVKYRQENV